MDQPASEDLVINEWESLYSLGDSTSRGSSPGRQDERQLSDPFQTVQSGQEYIASSDIKTQALQHAGLHRDEPSRRFLHRMSYGTNEDVYNPYQPFLSKEFIAQEIAAGRMWQAEEAQDSPRDLLTLPWTSRRSFSSPSEEIDQPPYTGFTKWRSGFGTTRRETALAIAAKSDAQISKSEDNSNHPPHFINDSAHRLRRSYVCPFRDEDLDESDPGSHIENHPLPVYLLEESSQDIDAPGASYSSLLSSGQHHMIKEQLRDSFCIKKTAEETKSSPLRHCPALTDMQAIYRSRDRKRRRADRSPEDAVIPRRPRRLSSDYCSAFVTSAMVNTSKAPGLRDQAELYVEVRMSTHRGGNLYASAIVGSWQDPLPEELQQLVGLTFTQYSSVHSSTPASTVTSTNMSSVSPLVFDPALRVFTSECIPQSFSPRKRRDVLDVFRTKAPYVPACILMVRDLLNIQYHVANNVNAFRLTSNQSHISQPGCGRESQTWPLDLIPLELFEQIASYLPHEDLKSARLVNKEFERKLSGYMFKSVVVPFGPEIYALARKDSKITMVTGGKSNLVARCKQKLLRPQSKIWKSFNIKGKGKQEGND